MPIQLTTDACVRLRHTADIAILTAHPVVRILFIRDRANGEDKEALVLDGQNFAWIALSRRAATSARDANGDLHAGSPIVLNRMSRLAADDHCSVLVSCVEVVYASAEDDVDAAPHNVTEGSHDVQKANERANLARRIGQLEHCLELVCTFLPPIFQALDLLNGAAAQVAANDR